MMLLHTSGIRTMDGVAQAADLHSGRIRNTGSTAQHACIAPQLLLTSEPLLFWQQLQLFDDCRIWLCHSSAAVAM
jgi:hypothetical protein